MTDEPRLFLIDLHRRVEEVFEEIVYRHWPPAGPAEWRPVVDVYETRDAYRVEIDLPGVAPEDVHLTVGDRTLVVTGTRHAEQPDGTLASRCERTRGRFRRVLEFAETIEIGRARADYRFGTYSVILPKNPSPSTISPATPGSVELVIERHGG